MINIHLRNSHWPCVCITFKMIFSGNLGWFSILDALSFFVVCCFLYFLSVYFARACPLVTLSRRHSDTETLPPYPPNSKLAFKVGFSTADPNPFSMGCVFLCTNFNLKTVLGQNLEIFLKSNFSIIRWLRKYGFAGVTVTKLRTLFWGNKS